MLRTTSNFATRGASRRALPRERRWPLAPGDGFQLVAIAFAVTLGVLAWALLAAAA